jgi:hypothetical protein
MKNMKPVTGINAGKEIGRPSVLAGDSIYYKHPEHGGPHHGVVAGIGKDGMLVDADGGDEHQVLWDGYIAHRARAERKLTIVDRGEDGSIMEDENGKRVFVQGKVEDYEAPLEKALISVPAIPEAPENHPLFESMYTMSNLLEAVIRAQAEMSANVVAAIAQLKDSQAAQFQGLCAAIAMMSDKQGDVSSMQSAMLGALLEARKPQDISISLPEGMMQKSEPANIQVDVHVPQQPAPMVIVEAAAITFSPVVQVPEAAPPQVVVSPAAVVVNIPERQELAIVSMPTRKTEAKVERDNEGNLKSSTNIESDM